MFSWANIVAQEAHHQELAREAELDRLIRRAQTRPRSAGLRLGFGGLLIAKRPSLIDKSSAVLLDREEPRAKPETLCPECT